MKQSPTAYHNTQKKKARQADVLRLVAEGLPLTVAARQVGVSIHTVNSHWRKEDGFYERLTIARAQGDNWVGSSFIDFRKIYFGRDTPPHQVLMVDAIMNAEPRSWTMILAPPESGKTSLLEDLYCFMVATDPNSRICVLSESQHHARKVIAHVARRMTDTSQFPAYIRQFGPFKEKPEEKSRSHGYDHEFRRPWNADYFTVLKADHDERDFTIESKGAGSAILGSRYGLVVLDDVCSKRNVTSSAELLEDITQETQSRLIHGVGKIVVIGTRVGPGDFYEKALEREGLIDHLVKIPAVDRHGESYWPEQRPLEDLEKIRVKSSAQTWDCLYMQRARSRFGASFPDEVLREARDDRLKVHNTSLGTAVVSSCDPSHSGNAAFATFAYDSERIVLVDLEVLERPGNNENHITQVDRISARWRPQTWVLESDHAAGKALFEDVRLRAVADKWGFDLVGHRTGGNKSEPVLGVTAMAAALRSHEIVLPYGDETSRAVVDPLTDELRAWRPDVPPKLCVQDRLMALWFAWRWWLGQRDVLTPTDEALWVPSWLREPVPA